MGFIRPTISGNDRQGKWLQATSLMSDFNYHILWRVCSNLSKGHKAIEMGNIIQIHLANSGSCAHAAINVSSMLNT